MGDAEYPEWRKAYREALLEVDSGKLPTRIFAAEMAIITRLEALRANSDGHREREAIKGALNVLRVLQKEELNYPAWENSA